MFPEAIDVARFEQICDWLRSWFKVLPLRDAVQKLFAGQLPARALAITFDDGYADNLTCAAPVLAARHMPCTFFVASGYLDGGCMWNDVVIEAVRAAQGPVLDLRGVAAVDGDHTLADAASRRALAERLIGRMKYLSFDERTACAREVARRARLDVPTDLMMTSDQLRDLAQPGFDIGGHTVWHPILPTLSEAAARKEIVTGRRHLQEITGQEVALFAYPNGKPGSDYNEGTIALVREAAFEAAVSTAWGAARKASARFELPRFTPWDRSRTRYGLRLAHNLTRRVPGGPLSREGAVSSSSG